MLYSTDYEYAEQWARAVPILVRAMVKADDQLHVLGPEEVVDQELALRTATSGETQELLSEQDAAMQGQRGASLLNVSTGDGTIRSGYKLPTTPVFDGIAAAHGRLFIALSDGTITCIGDRGEPLERISDSDIERYNANAALPVTPARRQNPAAKKPAEKN
jgi:hypothetical protein